MKFMRGEAHVVWEPLRETNGSESPLSTAGARPGSAGILACRRARRTQRKSRQDACAPRMEVTESAELSNRWVQV